MEQQRRRAETEIAAARADAVQAHEQLMQAQAIMQKMALDQASHLRSDLDQTSPDTAWRSLLNAIQRHDDRSVRLLTTPDVAPLFQTKGPAIEKQALFYLLEPLRWQERTERTASALQGKGAQCVRSMADCTLAGASTRTSCSTPRPPRNFPAPPESWRSLRCAIKIGPLPSPASTGVLCVSPSLMQNVAFCPSRSCRAPQPPPESVCGK